MGAQPIKESTYNIGDLGSISAFRRFHGEGLGNPLRYSCLKNPLDRGAWHFRTSQRSPWDFKESDMAKRLSTEVKGPLRWD